MTDQSRVFNDNLHDLIVGIARLETKIDMLGNVRELAIEAQQSTKAAHNRIDEIKREQDKKFDDYKKDNDEKVKELSGHITWLWRCGGAALIGGAITLLFEYAKRGG